MRFIEMCWLWGDLLAFPAVDRVTEMASFKVYLEFATLA